MLITSKHQELLLLLALIQDLSSEQLQVWTITSILSASINQLINQCQKAVQENQN